MVLSFVVWITYAVGAMVLCLAVLLILRKYYVQTSERLLGRVSDQYLGLITPVLLAEGEGGSEELIAAWKLESAGAIRALGASLMVRDPWRRRVRRRALQRVLEQLGRDLSGSAVTRMTHLFERLGFVERNLRRLRHRRWWVRAEACRELAVMRSRIVLLPLVGLLQDPEGEVRQEAARALIATVGVGDALGAILENSTSISRWFAIGLTTAVEQAGASALPHLLAALDSNSASVRVFAIRMLGVLADPQVVPALLARLSGWQGEEFSEALIALGKAGDERALPALLVQLETGDTQAKRAAAMGLGSLGAPEAVEPLVSVVLQEALPVRFAAAEALATIDGPGRDGLRALLASAEPTARAVALDVLDREGGIENLDPARAVK